MRIVILLVVLTGVARAQPRTVAAGFDHMVHARTIDVRNEPAIACTRCHAAPRGKLVGRPDHAACFTAPCHGAAPVAPKAKQPNVIPPERAKICLACHSEAALAQPFVKTVPVGYPPYTFDQDFTVLLGHKQHAATACAACHADPAAKRAAPQPPHARCAGCHDGLAGKGPAMVKCESCHRRATGKPQPPALAEPTLPIASTFSHATHAQRSAAGRACATCHAGVTGTDDPTLPRPDATTCATSGCHDGKGAFSIVTACTKCHRDPPVRTFKIVRPTPRFLHAQHDAAAIACTGCHRIAPNGEPIAAKHESCTSSTCHPNEFGSPAPTICGACHNTTEPWRALRADRAPPDASEFGATLDHGKHAKGACTDCHRLRTASRELRTPRGHGSCTTSGCHATSSGPAPAMTACEGCHQRGLMTTRDATRLAAPWTVRGRFSHTSAHRVGAQGPIACTTCHDDLASVTVLSLATPAKARCAPCHDGTTSFKLTGTDCKRCHGARER